MVHRFMASAKVLGEETVNDTSTNGVKGAGQGGR